MHTSLIWDTTSPCCETSFSSFANTSSLTGASSACAFSALDSKVVTYTSLTSLTSVMSGMLLKLYRACISPQQKHWTLQFAWKGLEVQSEIQHTGNVPRRYQGSWHKQSRAYRKQGFAVASVSLRHSRCSADCTAIFRCFTHYTGLKHFISPVWRGLETYA